MFNVTAAMTAAYHKLSYAVSKYRNYFYFLRNKASKRVHLYSQSSPKTLPQNAIKLSLTHTIYRLFRTNFPRCWRTKTYPSSCYYYGEWQPGQQVCNAPSQHASLYALLHAISRYTARKTGVTEWLAGWVHEHIQEVARFPLHRLLYCCCCCCRHLANVCRCTVSDAARKLYWRQACRGYRYPWIYPCVDIRLQPSCGYIHGYCAVAFAN